MCYNLRQVIEIQNKRLRSKTKKGVNSMKLFFIAASLLLMFGNAHGDELSAESYLHREGLVEYKKEQSSKVTVSVDSYEFIKTQNFCAKNTDNILYQGLMNLVKKETYKGTLVKENCSILLLKSVVLYEDTQTKVLGDLAFPVSLDISEKVEKLFDFVSLDIEQFIQIKDLTYSQKLDNPFPKGKNTRLAHGKFGISKNQFLTLGIPNKNIQKISQETINEIEIIPEENSATLDNYLNKISNNIDALREKYHYQRQCIDKRADIVKKLKKKNKVILKKIAKKAVERYLIETNFIQDEIVIDASLILKDLGQFNDPNEQKANELLNANILKAATNLGVRIQNIGSISTEFGSIENGTFYFNDNNIPDLPELVLVVKGIKTKDVKKIDNSIGNFGNNPFTGSLSVNLLESLWDSFELSINRTGNSFSKSGFDVDKFSVSLRGTGTQSVIANGKMKTGHVDVSGTGAASIAANIEAHSFNSRVTGTGGTSGILNSKIRNAFIENANPTGATMMVLNSFGGNYFLKNSGTGATVVIDQLELSGQLNISNKGTGPSISMNKVRAKDITISGRTELLINDVFSERSITLCNNSRYGRGDKLEVSDFIVPIEHNKLQAILTSVYINTDRYNRGTRNQFHDSMDELRDKMRESTSDYEYDSYRKALEHLMDLSDKFKHASRYMGLRDLRFYDIEGSIARKLSTSLLIVHDDNTKFLDSKVEVLIAPREFENIEYKYFIPLSEL